MGKLLGIVAVIVVAVVGWFWWSGSKTAEAPVKTDVNQPMATEMPSGTTQSEAKGLVTSIRDAMGLGKKMECTFSTEADGKTFQSTVVIDGSTFKTMSNMGSVTTYGFFDGSDQYTWMSNSKEGYKMSRVCMEELKDLAPADGATPQAQPQDLQKEFDSAQNVNCVPATAADFDLPKDVTFTDQCAMMKQSLEMMKQVKGQLPAGLNIPGMPTGN